MSPLEAFRFGVAAFACSASGAPAMAQTAISYRAVCQNIGTSPSEPLADREGHSLSVIQQLCRVEGGPLDGGVMTGTAVYEWDKTNGIGLSGLAVVRKSGAAVVVQLGEFRNTLTVTDGRVTGFSSSGQGTYKLATGSAAALAGKGFSFVARPTAPGQYAIEFKVD